MLTSIQKEDGVRAADCFNCESYDFLSIIISDKTWVCCYHSGKSNNRQNHNHFINNENE